MKPEEMDDLVATLARLGGVGMTPRECLVVALAAASDEERALAIVGALDEYLQEGQDRAPMVREDLRPRVGPIDEVRAERDAAVARAEKAERELRATKKPKKPKKRRP